MIFSSTLFIFIFLPVIFLFYYCIPQRYLRARNILLLCGSLIFYSWGEPAVAGLLLFSTAVNYFLGIALGRLSENRALSRFIMAAAVIFNIGLLGYFKYADFIAENINGVLGTGFVPNIALPIGISFFTFQILSYVIDIYTGNVKPQRSFIKLALYISFFPQLIAGPIVRYTDIEIQLDCRVHSAGAIAGGFQRFIIGLSKKILIANQTAIFADYAFSSGTPPLFTAWLGALCYALQIYYDFSGYSDMAIGLGNLFGFRFSENFNYPYTALTLQDFWRRWHISLSGWFRDYLYIPLGGSRRGTGRTYLNLLTVFAVTGLWHGADWSFVIWGIYHGAFLLLERGTYGKILKKLPRPLTWLLTANAVLIGWVIFRAEDTVKARAYIKCMFDFSDMGLTRTLANLDTVTLAALIPAAVFCAPVLPLIKRAAFGAENHFARKNLHPLKYALSWGSIAGCLGMLVLSIIFLTGSDFNPFLYFRF